VELYIVRHGQSEGNAGTSDGPDPALTELGRKQALLAGERLLKEEIEIMYCSPTLRALQTAQIIGNILGLRPNVWADLTEKGSMGDYNGMTRSQIEELFPEVVLSDDIKEDGWWFIKDEMEEDAYRRAERVRSRLMELYGVAAGKVLLVSHGTFGSILMSVFVGAPPCGYIRFSQWNCSISKIEVLPNGQIKLRYQNSYCHLPDHAIT